MSHAHAAPLESFLRYALETLPTFIGSHFVNHDTGLFYERLDASGKPISLPYTRLVTQCRLIISCCLAAQHGSIQSLQDYAHRAYNEVLKKFAYPHEPGRWLYALGTPPSDLPKAATSHLYAHAFFILASALYFKSSNDSNALEQARATARYLARSCAIHPGYATAVTDEGQEDRTYTRQQNPHMHLFEAALFAYEVSGDTLFKSLAEEILDLLFSTLINQSSGTVTEHFSHAWTPDSAMGSLVEPGHHFEWAWLLMRWTWLCEKTQSHSKSDLHYPCLKTALELTLWAERHGIDRIHGGFFDEVLQDGTQKTITKRIWPLCEALKAIRCLTSDARTSYTNRSTEEMILKIFSTHYALPESGTWRERLNSDLSVHTNYLPGTTPYHIIMAAHEIIEVQRGSYRLS
jgi:mannose/cellobiose epimerase-like protein (N-acyl-D-glucosamine 2-epimerase family)